MRNTKADHPDHMESIKEAAHDIVTDAKEGTAEVGADLARLKDEIISAVKAAVASVYNGTQHKAEDVYDAARKQGADAVKSLEKRVAQKPLTSLAIAAGVGALIGLLLRRR